MRRPLILRQHPAEMVDIVKHAVLVRLPVDDAGIIEQELKGQFFRQGIFEFGLSPARALPLSLRGFDLVLQRIGLRIDERLHIVFRLGFAAALGFFRRLERQDQHLLQLAAVSHHRSLLLSRIARTCSTHSATMSRPPSLLASKPPPPPAPLRASVALVFGGALTATRMWSSFISMGIGDVPVFLPWLGAVPIEW